MPIPTTISTDETSGTYVTAQKARRNRLARWGLPPNAMPEGIFHRLSVEPRLVLGPDVVACSTRARVSLLVLVRF